MCAKMLKSHLGFMLPGRVIREVTGDLPGLWNTASLDCCLGQQFTSPMALRSFPNFLTSG